jgi:hypothetical protein
VQTLVDFNRPVELRLSDFDLRRLAEDVVALAAPDAPGVSSQAAEFFENQLAPAKKKR